MVVVVADGGPVPSVPAHPQVSVLTLDRHHGSRASSATSPSARPPPSYLAFLDDDNVWRPDHLEVSLAAHARGAELTYTGMRQVHLDGSGGQRPSRCRSTGGRSATASYVDTSTIVVRRGHDVRFQRGHGGRRVYEDWNLVFRLSRRLRTELVPEVTVDYLVHSGGHMQHRHP